MTELDDWIDALVVLLGIIGLITACVAGTGFVLAWCMGYLG